MKKFRQRKTLVAWMLAAAVSFFLGGHFAWRGITHRGTGYWTFGGEAPYGGIGTEEHTDKISEQQYKRQCYGSAAIFLVLAGGTLWEVVKKWNERNGLERSWEQTISHSEALQDIRKHPESYRDDFKQWLRENHPEFGI